MSSMKIKKDDMVKVIAGKDKGKEGKVLAVNVKDNTLLVEGINMVTKHAKPSMANQQGGILHQEAPIDASNVMLLVNGKATRVGFKMDGDKKVRFAKATGEIIREEAKKLSRLKEQYENEIKDAMVKKFGYKNVMEIPKLDKIVVNMGVGEAKENAKILEAAVKDMEAITGQKAVTTKAKNAVANFKIREGMPIGCKVTLRGEKMYEFADRLINLALPRVRDFRGVNPNAFDGRGNYALGIKEQIIFPEIEYDKVDKVRGMDVIFVTTAKTDEEARELLTLFNMPFTK